MSKRIQRTKLGGRIVRAAMLLALALVVVGCEDDLLNDPTFRQWCGDKLCSWTLESGKVQRAPTWHRDDYGVEFVDAPTAISQVVDKSAKCLLFTSVANVDPVAQMTVEIDFNDDGSTDYVWPVPSAAWREVQTLITAPPAYSGFKITVRKAGSGHAVLAQMRLQSVDECDAGAAVKLQHLALGTTCGDADSCESGVCCRAAFGFSVCSECCSAGLTCLGPRCASACSADQRCDDTVEDPTSGKVWLACRALLPKGARCRTSSECQSGFCTPSRKSAERGVMHPGCAKGSAATDCAPETDDGGNRCQ